MKTSIDANKSFVVNVQGNVHILKDWVNDLCKRIGMDLDTKQEFREPTHGQSNPPLKSLDDNTTVSLVRVLKHFRLPFI